jgi:hypothetical protein
MTERDSSHEYLIDRPSNDDLSAVLRLTTACAVTPNNGVIVPS